VTYVAAQAGNPDFAISFGVCSLTMFFSHVFILIVYIRLFVLQ